MGCFDVRLRVCGDNKREVERICSTIGKVLGIQRVAIGSTKSVASRYERQFAEALSGWLGGKVVRSPGSGSHKNVVGDFVGIDPKSASFFELFAIELKTTPTAKYKEVLDTEFLRFLGDVVDKHFTESYKFHVIPIAVFRMKYFDVIAIDHEVGLKLFHPSLVGCTRQHCFVVTQLERLFKTDPEDLKLVARQILKRR